ncbi:MAG: amino acid permease [Thermoguttaceae bacterium]
MTTSSSSTPAIEPAAPKRQLTLFDSTSIIVGIILGAAIYESSPLIAKNVPGFSGLMIAWLLGGLCSLVGAMCYAELATAYPRAGGDYVYLTRAFGRAVGFLFAWAQLWVVRPGSIGAMGFIFARYANELYPLPTGSSPTGQALAMILYAAGSIVVLSVINILGVPEGKWTQNILTTAKVLGLLGITVVGFCFSSAPAVPAAAAPAGSFSQMMASFGFAMIFVFYAYGGWNEMAYVGSEVRDPERNISRALVLGTLAVTAIYALVTGAFVHALGLDGVRRSSAVASEVLQLGLGPWGARLMSLLVCLSALGAINGMIFTGARIYYAMGKDHRLYTVLGRWSPRFGTPVTSLAIQALLTIVLVVGFGLSRNGFERMVVFTTPVFWIFLLLVGVAVFVLRVRDRGIPRPYRVPGYPLTPVLFCLYSLYMIYTSLDYAIGQRSSEAFWAIGLLLVGILFCFYDPRPAARENGEAEKVE